jgi:hypothetical protein
LTKFAYENWKKLKNNQLKSRRIKIPRELSKSFKKARLVIPIHKFLYARLPTKEED